MELSRLVARVIAVVYVSAGLGGLFGKVNFHAIAEELVKSPALAFCAGCLGMVGGTVLVQYHNHWVGNWTVLVTIVSWMFLAGGVLVVVYPRSLFWAARFYRQSRLWGLLMICFGLLFGFFGFAPLTAG